MTDLEILQITPERKKLFITELKVLNKRNFKLPVFDPIVVSFFNNLSKSILADSDLNKVAALAALGFWLRKSHINQIIAENQHITNSKKIHSSPLGVVFHICPSNVDTMFLYSLAISLLVGNKNILRISQRFSDPLIEKIFELISDNLKKEEFKLLQEYICIVSYGHNNEINEYFSGKADARIIWGGDATINTFKTFATGTRTRDIAFADRISCSIFNTKAFNKETSETKKELARKFFNDSYTFDQKGCSSPQFIFLLGKAEDNKIFEKDFYDLLSYFSSHNYNNDIASIASMKLNKLVEDSINEQNVNSVIKESNYLYFLNMDQINHDLIHSCGAGYFYVQQLNEINQIQELINKKVQTATYFGLSDNELIQLCDVSNGLGIDRIVPVGSALDFEYIWDGFNLLDELTSKKWVIQNK